MMFRNVFASFRKRADVCKINESGDTDKQCANRRHEYVNVRHEPSVRGGFLHLENPLKTVKKAKIRLITEKFLYFPALDVWRIEKITIFAGSKVVTSAARRQNSRQLSLITSFFQL